jgi:catechol 2,3-dioxygenase-like lactoylglutathione lyase family enzyme
MNTVETSSKSENTNPSQRRLDLKLEVVTIPVSDVDRAKRFYASLGWRLDTDLSKGEVFRTVQFTPPGSPCSIHFGKGTSSGPMGPLRNIYLVVFDIQAARADLLDRGVAVSEVFHQFPGEERGSGPDPERRTYRSYATFSDPDGNSWLLQEITARFPGRVESDCAGYASSAELAVALRRAEVAHGQHEKLTGQRDANWSDWYAEYMVKEQTGKTLPR